MLLQVYILKFIMPLLVPKVRNLCLKNLINKNVGWQQRSSFLVGVGHQNGTAFIIVITTAAKKIHPFASV